MESQRTTKSHNNLEKEGKNWNITLPDFKIDCEAVVIKTVLYWHEDSYLQTNDYNRKPRNKSSYIWSNDSQLGYQNGITWERTVSLTNNVEKIGYLYAKE